MLTDLVSKLVPNSLQKNLENASSSKVAARETLSLSYRPFNWEKAILSSELQFGSVQCPKRLSTKTVWALRGNISTVLRLYSKSRISQFILVEKVAPQTTCTQKLHLHLFSTYREFLHVPCPNQTFFFNQNKSRA